MADDKGRRRGDVVGRTMQAIGKTHGVPNPSRQTRAPDEGAGQRAATRVPPPVDEFDTSAPITREFIEKERYWEQLAEESESFREEERQRMATRARLRAAGLLPPAEDDDQGPANP